MFTKLFLCFTVGFLHGFICPYLLKKYAVIETVFLYLVTLWSKIELKANKFIKVLKDEAKKYPFVWKLYIHYLKQQSGCGFRLIKNDNEVFFVHFQEGILYFDDNDYDYVIGKFLNETNETVYNVVADTISNCIQDVHTPTSFQFIMVEVIFQSESQRESDFKEEEEEEPLAVNLKGKNYNYMIVGNKITKLFFKYFLRCHYREKYEKYKGREFKVRILDNNFKSFELIDSFYLTNHGYYVDQEQLLDFHTEEDEGEEDEGEEELERITHDQKQKTD